LTLFEYKPIISDVIVFRIALFEEFGASCSLSQVWRQPNRSQIGECFDDVFVREDWTTLCKSQARPSGIGFRPQNDLILLVFTSALTW
jgi:hypothetical protein